MIRIKVGNYNGPKVNELDRVTQTAVEKHDELPMWYREQLRRNAETRDYFMEMFRN